MRISDWSSDVCSSDLSHRFFSTRVGLCRRPEERGARRGDRGDDQARPDRPCLAHLPLGLRLRQFVRGAFHVSSEERRVGKECVCTSRYWWARIYNKKTNTNNIKKQRVQLMIII